MRSASGLALARREIVLPAHRSEPVTRWVNTLGPHVADVNAAADFPPDPEQEICLDAIFAERADGRPEVFETGVMAPRQNIKTGLMKQAAVGWLYVTDERRIVYSAHEWNPAVGEMVTDMAEMIRSTPQLDRRTVGINTGNGDEQIVVGDKWRPRKMLFKTRVKSPLRSLAADKLLIDEALFLEQGQMGGMIPTLSTRPMAQIVYGSSPLLATSDVLREVQERAFAGCRCQVCEAWRAERGIPFSVDPRLAWFEWCAPPPAIACDRGEKCDHGRRTAGCGCDKPEMIAAANSQYGRRIPPTFFVDERKSMAPAEYAREVMGWGDAPALPGGVSPINVAKFEQLVVDDPDDVPARMPFFAVEVDQDRAWAAVGAAGSYEDGEAFIELVARGRGTSWLVDRCKELDGEHGPATFAVDGGGPASDLIKPLERAGLNVVTMGLPDVVAACGGIVDKVNAGTVWHGPDEDMLDAVKGVRKRVLKDGAVVFGRLKSDVDITPITAPTFALWLLDELDYDIEDSVL